MNSDGVYNSVTGRPAQGSKRPLPLRLKGSLGAPTHRNHSVFGGNIMHSDDYKYNGVKWGARWKSKVTREEEEGGNDSITHETFADAVCSALTEDQRLNLNAAVWVFLAGCLSGTAETMFKRAEPLNCLDAWRIISRQVSHSRAIHLEALRSEMEELHNRPIRPIEGVEEGVAEFENVRNRLPAGRWHHPTAS